MAGAIGPGSLTDRVNHRSWSSVHQKRWLLSPPLHFNEAAALYRG